MKLTVSTPLAIAVDQADVAHVRAEDASGAFGILPGHADFLTVLTVSVLTWRDGAGALHHVAVRGGVLDVRHGQVIAVATREAVADDDLARLEAEVLAGFLRRQDEERVAHIDSQRLYLSAIRRICQSLRAESPARGGFAQ